MQNPSAKFEPFPSIEGFRKAKKQIEKYKYTEVAAGELAPTALTLRGTVKLHGTHADIVFTPSSNGPLIHFQSRNRVLRNAKDQDNCGFARFMEDLGYRALDEYLFQPAMKIVETRPNDALEFSSDDEDDGPYGKSCKAPPPTTEPQRVNRIMISGEFCGGNIQKGVALTQLPRMFVIFSVKINGHFVDSYEYRSLQIVEKQVYNIYRVEPFRIPVRCQKDSDIPKQLQTITDAVEQECPFAKSFNVSGTGEGVVWCVEEFAHRSRFYFKVKGDEHKTSGIITLKPKSTKEILALQNANTFAMKALPDARLQQGLDYLREMNLDISPQNTSAYMKWIVEDVMKEEADDIKVLGMDVTKLKKKLSALAIRFYREAVTWAKEKQQQ